MRSHYNPRMDSPSADSISSWRIDPAGDRCLIVTLGDRVDAGVNQQVLALAAALLANPLEGVIDVVPTFTTVALHYLPQAYAGRTSTPFDCLAASVRERLELGIPDIGSDSREVEIPACYGGSHGPDLDEVAERCGLTSREVIELHGASPLVIYTFFFSPGTPFAGGLDPRLALPRRATPRTEVPAGSVAIANGLSMIYQLAMPGGWNLIGRTPWSLFDLARDPPVRLRLGDRLRFVPISPAEFDRLYEARQ